MQAGRWRFRQRRLRIRRSSDPSTASVERVGTASWWTRRPSARSWSATAPRFCAPEITSDAGTVDRSDVNLSAQQRPHLFLGGCTATIAPPAGNACMEPAAGSHSTPQRFNDRHRRHVPDNSPIEWPMTNPVVHPRIPATGRQLPPRTARAARIPCCSVGFRRDPHHCAVGAADAGQASPTTVLERSANTGIRRAIPFPCPAIRALPGKTNTVLPVPQSPCPRTTWAAQLVTRHHRARPTTDHEPSITTARCTQKPNDPPTTTPHRQHRGHHRHHRMRQPEPPAPATPTPTADNTSPTATTGPAHQLLLPRHHGHRLDNHMRISATNPNDDTRTTRPRPAGYTCGARSTILTSPPLTNPHAARLSRNVAGGNTLHGASPTPSGSPATPAAAKARQARQGWCA